MFTEWFELVVLVVVGFLSGAINAVAGGGSLLVFPALLATGMPPLIANVTNSVAQGPGFVGAAVSQRADLGGARRRLVLTSVAAAIGSVIGCVLLLILPGAVFDAVVPALIALSAVLMAFQNTIRRWLGQPAEGGPDRTWGLTIGIFLASIYGGYFGGARSVIFIAVLVLAVNDSMRRLNALKSWLGLIGSAVTFAVYALIAPVDWIAVLTLVPTTVLGGFAGGKIAQRLPATLLRYVVVVIAAGVAVYMVLD
ncbi:MAG: sulfite exporter TauE/SafE family protein [Saccharopolyspora sp.]|uniref:sulfite exporter TauE/SafE family protein n=1 Tax=Saccharopolyspora TaxID=1835 RepID=UPI001909AE27|nr:MULTISPECIES: sulfite exporter TauE/SafE family protein [unclassified Saccharopolyspora]MBK0870042.1 sulfite exporter TauE/SafE family protein [Saccharopolyspora sp. HNM0986]MBQ6639751.1 sulfite exporter TauE/SafE family protein [Saccharopolyspora sp.]